MRLLRWYVARWLIHLGLHIAPPGAAKDAIEHSIRRTGIYMMAAIAAKVVTVRQETEIEMAEREYKDSEGNVVTLDKLVRIEPEWAANMIRWYEGKLDEVEAMFSPPPTGDSERE